MSGKGKIFCTALYYCKNKAAVPKMTYCLPNCFLYPRTACIMKYRVVQKSYQCKSFISWPTATCPQATDLHQMSCRIVIHSSINGILNLKRLNFMEFFLTLSVLKQILVVIAGGTTLACMTKFTYTNELAWKAQRHLTMQKI